jgi:hypothetical protein
VSSLTLTGRQFCFFFFFFFSLCFFYSFFFFLSTFFFFLKDFFLKKLLTAKVKQKLHDCLPLFQFFLASSHLGPRMTHKEITLPGGGGGRSRP